MVILYLLVVLLPYNADSEVSDAEIEKFIASLGGSAAQAPETPSSKSKAETSAPVAEKQHNHRLQQLVLQLPQR